jgi:hypothetical protein
VPIGAGAFVQLPVAVSHPSTVPEFPSSQWSAVLHIPHSPSMHAGAASAHSVLQSPQCIASTSVLDSHVPSASQSAYGD